jgi:hypothetical protein
MFQIVAFRIRSIMNRIGMGAEGGDRGRRMESRITEKVGDATMMYEQMKLKIVSGPPLFSRQLQAFGL